MLIFLIFLPYLLRTKPLSFPCFCLSPGYLSYDSLPIVLVSFFWYLPYESLVPLLWFSIDF
nr:MAG TPA: hypothetical protein [Caudoviricetes sp.]